MHKKYIFIIAVILLVLIAGGFIIFRSQSTNSTSVSASNVNEKVITLNASRFVYDPGTISVNQGDKVKIIINNLDTNHGIAIPDYNVQGVNSVEFVADKKGEFEFHCNIPCGPGHKEMKGTLIVN